MSISINNIYNIRYDKEIGSGLTAKVYEGLRRKDNLTTAIKIIFRNKITDKTTESFANEISALKKLNHPNIVKLYDIFEDRSHYYVAMEYISGGELFDRISAKTAYSESDAKNICLTILAAIKHCHDNDIVHCDIKPENLMMLNSYDDAAIKLVDFGFSSVAKGLSLHKVHGTFNYMAPEIWNNEYYGKAVDMWAFGVVLYTLLGGYNPFHHDNKRKLMQLIVSSNFEFHDVYWNHVSDEAKSYIKSLLSVNVDQRLTVDQALEHQWLQQSKAQIDLSQSLKRLKEFNAKKKFHSAFAAVRAMNEFKHAGRPSEESPEGAAEAEAAPASARDESLIGPADPLGDVDTTPYSAFAQLMRQHSSDIEPHLEQQAQLGETCFTFDQTHTHT